MAKKSGFTDSLFKTFTFILGAAFFIALLSRFEWDIIAMFSWIVQGVWNIILTVANVIAGNESFREITS